MPTGRPKVSRDGYDMLARIAIFDAGDMTPQKRRQIARWLRHQANFLVASGEEFAPKYTARYYLPKEEPEVRRIGFAGKDPTETPLDYRS